GLEVGAELGACVQGGVGGGGAEAGEPAEHVDAGEGVVDGALFEGAGVTLHAARVEGVGGGDDMAFLPLLTHLLLRARGGVAGRDGLTIAILEGESGAALAGGGRR